VCRALIKKNGIKSLSLGKGLIVTLNKNWKERNVGTILCYFLFYLYFPKEERGYRSETLFLFILQHYEEIKNGS
jgi:hypothetical protein